MLKSQNSLLGFWTRNSARLFVPISNNFPNVSHLMPRASEIIFLLDKNIAKGIFMLGYNQWL